MLFLFQQFLQLPSADQLPFLHPHFLFQPLLHINLLLLEMALSLNASLALSDKIFCNCSIVYGLKTISSSLRLLLTRGSSLSFNVRLLDIPIKLMKPPSYILSFALVKLYKISSPFFSTSESISSITRIT